MSFLLWIVITFYFTFKETLASGTLEAAFCLAPTLAEAFDLIVQSGAEDEVEVIICYADGLSGEFPEELPSLPNLKEL